MSAQFNDVQMMDQTQQQKSYPSYLSIPKIRVIVRKRPLSKKELAVTMLLCPPFFGYHL